jgi:CBS domain-containing protein
MSRWKVRDVMTADVVSIRENALFHEIVEVLARRGISAVPVVDAKGRVLGVVSEADLLSKVEFADGDEPHLFESRRHRVARDKASGAVAYELMSVPAVTVTADVSVVEAAKLLETIGVKRLPVVDSRGHLIGIVSRRDLLGVFLRPDAAIRTEIIDEVLVRLGLDPTQIAVAVAGGVVTLTGELECRSVTALLVELVGRVDGVVAVVDRLSYRVDDTAESGLSRLFSLNHP